MPLEVIVNLRHYNKKTKGVLNYNDKRNDKAYLDENNNPVIIEVSDGVFISIIYRKNRGDKLEDYKFCIVNDKRDIGNKQRKKTEIGV